MDSATAGGKVMYAPQLPLLDDVCAVAKDYMVGVTPETEDVHAPKGCRERNIQHDGGNGEIMLLSNEQGM